MKHYLNEQEQRKMAGIVNEALQVPFSPRFTKTYKQVENLLDNFGGYLKLRGTEKLKEFRDRQTKHYLDHAEIWTDAAKRDALERAEYRLMTFYNKLNDIAVDIEKDL